MSRFSFCLIKDMGAIMVSIFFRIFLCWIFYIMLFMITMLQYLAIWATILLVGVEITGARKWYLAECLGDI